MRPPQRWAALLLTTSCLLLTAVTGCESLERKLTRKPKHPPARPSPIINFEDYTATRTPLDRYRKHYLIFDYWNSQLLEELQSRTPNPKRLTRASTEALGELETLQQLMTEAMAARLSPVIASRRAIEGELRRGSVDALNANWLWRELEIQSRQIRRDFFWRNVEEHLREAP